MFPITITLRNVDQLNAVMASLSALDNGNNLPAPIIGKAEPAQPIVKTDAPEPKPEALTQMSAAEAVEKLDNVASKPAAPTYEETGNAVTKLVRTKGRDVALAVLKEFGISKLPEAKPEQYAAIFEECNKAMGV